MKIVVILLVAQLVTTVIFFSAWDKSLVKWDNSRNSTQKIRTHTNICRLKVFVPLFMTQEAILVPPIFSESPHPHFISPMVQVLLGGHHFPPFYQHYPPRPYEYGPKSLEKIVRHPNGGRLTYDIALLKMDSRVNLTPRIFPACFPGYEIQVVEFSNRGYKIRKICD